MTDWVWSLKHAFLVFCFCSLWINGFKTFVVLTVHSEFTFMHCVNLLIVHQIAFTSYQVVDHQMNHNLMYFVHMKQNQLNTWQEYSANRLRWLFLWLTVTLKDWQEIGQGVLSFDKDTSLVPHVDAQVSHL